MLRWGKYDGEWKAPDRLESEEISALIEVDRA